jgi:hypothetical protein
VGSFLSINSQSDAHKDSNPSPTIQDPEPQPVLPVHAAQVVTEPDPDLVSHRPLRRFTRAARGLDVFSQLHAAHSAAGSSSTSAPAKSTANKGVDQDGLPPQQ